MDQTIVLHQFHQKIGDFEKVFNYIKENTPSKKQARLHVYPELFLTGYPLQDLCLQKSFFGSYLKFKEKLNQYFKELKPSEDRHLMGGLTYHISQSGFPSKIQNSIILGIPGKGIEAIYHKRLLPTYDIFDEGKYFTPGEAKGSLEWNGLNIGLLICEDMWVSQHYSANPIQEMADSSEEYDLVINLSASPFNMRKQETRLQQAREISHILTAPFIYVNLVAEEDEILFDGGSFAVNADELISQMPSFQAGLLEIPFQKLSKNTKYKKETIEVSHCWEDLFKADLVDQKIQELSDNDSQEAIDAISFGAMEYAQKNGFDKFLVALSGGIDSTIVLTLTKLALKPGQEVEAIYMPSQYSSSQSLELSQKLCNNLGIDLKILPIKFIHSVVRNRFNDNFKTPLEGVPDENIQARLRGALLYARSNQTGAMVFNTSNKSEIAVGYSTLYGDSVGAISLIGDLYKSEIYQLAHYINKKYDNVIPKGIIERPPTAELRDNQKDSDSLPPYAILDTILECLLSYRYDRSDLINMGIKEEYIDKVLNLYCRSEFKRKQFCPIIKVKTKSFGFGYRVPINKSKMFYFD